MIHVWPTGPTHACAYACVSKNIVYSPQMVPACDSTIMRYSSQFARPSHRRNGGGWLNLATTRHRVAADSLRKRWLCIAAAVASVATERCCRQVVTQLDCCCCSCDQMSSLFSHDAVLHNNSNKRACTAMHARGYYSRLSSPNDDSLSDITILEFSLIFQRW